MWAYDAHMHKHAHTHTCTRTHTHIHRAIRLRLTLSNGTYLCWLWSIEKFFPRMQVATTTFCWRAPMCYEISYHSDMNTCVNGLKGSHSSNSLVHGWWLVISTRQYGDWELWIWFWMITFLYHFDFPTAFSWEKCPKSANSPLWCFHRAIITTCILGAFLISWRLLLRAERSQYLIAWLCKSAPTFQLGFHGNELPFSWATSKRVLLVSLGACSLCKPDYIESSLD